MDQFEKVFFLLAPSFHGATLLSRVAYSLPEVISLGDTYPANTYDQVCGCGLKTSECKFWAAIKKDVGAERYIKSELLLPALPVILGNVMDRYLMDWVPRPVALGIPVMRRAMSAFRSDYEMFLSAVRKHSIKKGSVFLDGVKSISRVNALVKTGFPVSGLIWVKRNPFNYLSSVKKDCLKAGRSFSPIRVALGYRRYHANVQRLSNLLPTIMIEYEEFTRHPESGIAQMATLFSVSEQGDFASSPWHFMGNSSLFGFSGTHRAISYPDDAEISRAIKLIL